MISFEAFTDELLKIAVSKHLTEGAMRRAMKLVGRHSEAGLSGDDLKGAYRAAMKESASVEVPLAERLKAFKLWKKTGEVPTARLGWKGDQRKFKGWGSTKGTHQRGGEATLYSGGADESLRSMVQRPMTIIDNPVYVPGQTRVATKGMYAAPDKADVAPYIGRGFGSPAVATMTVPRSQVVQQGYQTVIPSTARGVQLKSLGGL